MSVLHMDRIGGYLHRREALQGQVRRADLVYCNSLASLPALELAATPSVPIILHVHELEFSFRSGVGPVASRRMLDLAKRYIACSRAVAENLVSNHGVDPGAVDVVYEYVATDRAASPPFVQERKALRQSLGIAEDALVVGGSGSPGWRKGTDIFIQLAKRLAGGDRLRRIHFVWVGGSPNAPTSHEVLHDLERLGVGDCFTHVPDRQNPMELFRGMDVFALTSREDPFPLVCLEAASCGVPVVCFDGAGGMPEFVESDSGEVVPYLDVEAMSQAIVRLLDDEETRLRRGMRGREKVLKHHQVHQAGLQIIAAMQRTIAR